MENTVTKIIAVTLRLALAALCLGLIRAEAAAQTPSGNAAGQSWTSSTLGVKFVPAGNDGVLFSVWDVRLKDFQAFVDATKYDATAGMSSLAADGWKLRGDTWKSPGFKQTDDCPVTGVSWNDAKAFCDWLTKKEREEGKLGAKQEYRLPTDAEWSKAVGLDESATGTPKSKSMQIKNVYPWGVGWPPPAGAGNYSGVEARDARWPAKYDTIDGYNDGFPRTSPVGSFKANQFGLYDMGGNVCQWCEDKIEPADEKRVLRGAAWTNDGNGMLSSFRFAAKPDTRNDYFGFRIVLGTVGS